MLAGQLSEEGTDDVLTMALGRPEHQGRVRGQGKHVKASIYFDLPKQRKRAMCIEEKIQEGIKRFMAEETERIIRERDQLWQSEVVKLKLSLGLKNVDLEGSPNLVSQQGSCSKGVNDLELPGAKKKLDLHEGDAVVDDQNIETKVEEKTDVLQETKVEEKTDAPHETMVQEEKVEPNQPHQEKNKVAEVDDEGCLELETVGTAKPSIKV